MSDVVQISHNPLGLVDYGDTDSEEPGGEEEVNGENGNILVNIMNNNVQEAGNQNKNVATVTGRATQDRERYMRQFLREQHNMRMSASCFMLPLTSGEDNNSSGSGSSEHECESSCEISTNDEEDTCSYQEDELAPSSFNAIHWLSRSGSGGLGAINKDAGAETSFCKGLDMFDDNAKDGCDDEETETAPTINAEQTDDFNSFTKLKRSKLKNNEVPDFDLRTVLGNRGGKENIPADLNMPHGVSVTAEEKDSEKEIGELRSKIEADREQLSELNKEKRDNIMNLATTARKKKELEDQLKTVTQKHKSINDKRTEIDRNIDFTEQEISKDTDHLLRMLRSRITSRMEENLQTDQGPDSMAVTVRNSSFDEPRGVPLVDSVRNVNIKEGISTYRNFGPIVSQNVNVNLISNPKQSRWKTMDENYFLNNSGPDFFEYLNQQGVNAQISSFHPKEKYKCRICSVNVHDRKSLWSHLRGKKHGANMCDDSHDPDDELGYEETVQDWEQYDENGAPSSFSSDLRNLLKRKRESV